jgi:hypothetical protein
MFSNIIVGAVFLIDPGKPLEARVRHILLIKSPADSLVFEQVDYCRHVLGDLVEGIAIQTEVVTSFVSNQNIGTRKGRLTLPQPPCSWVLKDV